MLGFKPHITENEKQVNAIKEVLLNEINEGLIVADNAGDIVFTNDLGKAFLDCGLFGPIDIVSKNPKTFVFEGTEYTVKYKSLSEHAGFKGTIATLFSTEGIKEQKREIEELKDSLEKSSGFKSAFLANMSHEIRTPIHAIIGFADIIMKENVADNIRAQIDMIKDSSYSLLAIINDVLDLSKIESGKMELVCSNYYISYVIRDIEATYSLLASRKGLKFEIHLDDNIPSNMYGDKIRLRGTLLNILSNAVKYTKEGRIDLYIKVLEKKDQMVTLCFEVKDTGIGIKDEDKNRLFESFARFDIQNNYSIEGRGLGLSIAKGYMDLMGGKIEVESEYGVGSTFRVIVDQKIIDDSPVDMNVVNARKKKAEKTFAIKDYKALVVDDNPVNLTVANGLMKTYGLDVDKATGGKEAINACLQKEYDIIFMDQMMPETDGVMAMKEIRKISEYYAKQCTIIVLTADAMAGVRDRLMEEGFDEYLCKPLEIHRLEAMLLKFVPERKIVERSKEDTVNITIEESTPIHAAMPPEEDVSAISEKLGISLDILEKRIRDCGGSLASYKNVCEVAVKHSKAKTEKLKEAKSIGDYERYTIEIHALKSTLSSIGAMDLSERAKEQELAGIEGKTQVIDEKMEAFLSDYEAFIELLKSVVLGVDDSDKKAKAEGAGEEWSKDEMRQFLGRIETLVNAYNFGEVFEILDNVSKLEKGPETKAVIDDITELMNNMDIESLRTKLGELIS